MPSFVIFETNSMAITAKMSVTDSSQIANYSNTLVISADSLSNVEFANKVASGGGTLLSKVVCSITVAQSLFLSDAVAVCSMQISPVSNSCLVDIIHSNMASRVSSELVSVIVSSSNPYVLITSDGKSEFRAEIHSDINHYATPVTVTAT